MMQQGVRGARKYALMVANFSSHTRLSLFQGPGIFFFFLKIQTLLLSEIDRTSFYVIERHIEWVYCKIRQGQTSRILFYKSWRILLMVRFFYLQRILLLEFAPEDPSIWICFRGSSFLKLLQRILVSEISLKDPLSGLSSRYYLFYIINPRGSSFWKLKRAS